MRTLPLDGCTVELHTGVVSAAECAAIASFLDSIPQLKACEMVMHDGRRHPVEVGTCFLGAPEVLERFDPSWGWRQAFPPCIERLLPRLEAIAGRALRICLVCYYADGTRSGAFHTDPPLYGDTSVLTTLSVGAERTFGFRPVRSPGDVVDTGDSGDPVDLVRVDLPPGSLVVMREGCQQLYEHGLLPGPPDSAPRFSLSFRSFGT